MPKLVILGTSYSVPDEDHENTHMVLQGKDRLVLIDCVSNPIVRLKKAGLNHSDLTDILMTHYHPDHVSGVPLLLMGMGILNREKNLKIYNNLLKNIKILAVENLCSVYKISAEKFSQIKTENSYDLILADPPFFKDDIYQVAQNIIDNKYLRKDSFMVVERSVQTKEKDIRNFSATPFKIIGDTCLYKIN